MAQIYRLESDDSHIGGFRVRFPSGVTKDVTWRSEGVITPTLDAAKQYATSLVQSMLDDRRIDDLERTNVPSLVAAIQKIISDWNAVILTANLHHYVATQH